MASSTVWIDIHRDNSPSLSPLSPTIIHYQQKSQLPQISYHHNARNHDRYHHFQKQQSRKSSFRYHNDHQKTSRITKQRRQSSSLWQTHRSSNGRIYYYNTLTDQSQWQKPSRDQLISSSIVNKSPIIHHIHSQSSSKSMRFTSKSTSNHNDTRHFTRSHSVKNRDRTNYHHRKHRRTKDNIQLSEQVQEEKTTPTSPPPHEMIQIDLVDPFPTLNSSFSPNYSENISFQQNPSLYQSPSMINAILQLEHSKPNDRSNETTQVATEVLHLSNEQTRLRLYQLVSLRTELLSLRLRFERNRF